MTKTLNRTWFVDTEIIRDYYGDTIAIYFEWMNFFLKWIAVPGAFGLIFRVLNTMMYEDVSKSPLNALFSIGMSFWATLFITNWKRHQRGLKILWDNLYQSERHIEQTRPEFVGTPAVNPISEKMEPHYSHM